MGEIEMGIVSVEKNRIAFIIDSVNSAWAQNVWFSFAKSARKLKKDIFILPGGKLSSGHDLNNLRNRIYSLVNAENVDGLIFYSSCLKSNETTEDEFKQFYSGFKQIPFVSLADKIPGYPCVVFNNYLGMKELTAHCIKNHGAKRIAFLCGPATHYDALERLRGYKDALDEARLPSSHDNFLVTDPFAWEDGYKAAAQLFEERKLIPRRNFDTIIGASDDMTVDAIDYFSRRGFYVPRDYHALGFDNSLKSFFPECPLSTVMSSYKEMSSEAFRILIEYMDKKDSIPIEDILLPTKPVIRNSCGCGGSHYQFMEQKPAVNFHEPDEEALITRINEYLELGEREIRTFITPIIRAWLGISQKNNLKSAARSAEENFFHRFEKAVDRFFNTERDSGLLLRLLQDLFNSGLVSASQFMKFEPVLLKIIFKIWKRSSIHARYKRENQDIALNSLRFELLETRDKDSLVKSLAKHLPMIGIKTAGIALYIDDKTSIWVGSYSPGGINPVKEQSFPAALFVPESLTRLFSNGVFMIQPLFIEERALGYFIHTASGNNGSVYEELRSTISFALKSIFQFEENRVLTLQKQAVQAASEAKSQFMVNVAHGIRTPMNAVLDMAESMLLEKLNDRQRHYTDDIKKSTMALLNILNKILDLAKTQSGEIDYQNVFNEIQKLLHGA
jgi:DNA-binding LacI/PurR family transcriptional regulator